MIKVLRLLILAQLLVLLVGEDASDKKRTRKRVWGEPYGLITKLQTQCEVEGLAVGTALADNYNAMDEDTEWDQRIHSDFFTEHLGFFAVITTGVWGIAGKTAELHDANELQVKGGWRGLKNVSDSSYWALENQWLYMMGDSTTRQIWATFASPAAGNEFERNSKEWTRENCRRQYPHRRNHPGGDYFPDEGWGGKCGNNELTCDLSGYGPRGKLTFDWKHFPWEDYDEWLYSNEGIFGNNRTSEHDGHEVMAGWDGAKGDQAAALFDNEATRSRRLISNDPEHNHNHNHHNHNHDHDHEEQQGHGKGQGQGPQGEGEGQAEYVDGRHRHSRTNGEADLLELFQSDTDGFEENVASLFRAGQKKDQGQKTDNTAKRHRGLEGDGTSKEKKEKDENEDEDEIHRRPDIFVFQVGMHTCYHAWDNNNNQLNQTFVDKHEADLPALFTALKAALARPAKGEKEGTPYHTKTHVVVMTAGRLAQNMALDHCTWQFNRALAHEAHKAGFPVFEREEVERRLLFKSDLYLNKHKGKYIKPNKHLDAPGPQIIATALLGMISCLRRPERARERGEDKGLGLKETVVIHKSTDDDAVNYQ